MHRDSLHHAVHCSCPSKDWQISNQHMLNLFNCYIYNSYSFFASSATSGSLLPILNYANKAVCPQHGRKSWLYMLGLYMLASVTCSKATGLSSISNRATSLTQWPTVHYIWRSRQDANYTISPTSQLKGAKREAGTTQLPYRLTQNLFSCTFGTSVHSTLRIVLISAYSGLA